MNDETQTLNLEQLQNLITTMDLQHQCLTVFAFQSGLAVDPFALKYGTIRKEFEAGIVPMALFPENGFCVRELSSFGGLKFRAFVGKSTVDLLKKYLETRKDLTDESLVFPMSLKSMNLYFKEKAKAVDHPETLQFNSLRRIFVELVKNNWSWEDRDAELTFDYLIAHPAPFVNTPGEKMSNEQLRRFYSENVEPKVNLSI